jgi:hypothetical protein
MHFYLLKRTAKTIKMPLAIPSGAPMMIRILQKSWKIFLKGWVQKMISGKIFPGIR